RDFIRQPPEPIPSNSRSDVRLLHRSRRMSGVTAMQSACPLCASVATVEAREDVWHIVCPQCLRFTLDAYLFDLFDSARARGDVRILRLLPRLSDAAQQAAAAGGRLDLVAENWQAVARSGTDDDSNL